MESGYRRPTEKTKPKSRLLEAFLALFLLLMIVAILLPVYGGSAPSRITHAISNAKQVGLGLLMYESDYDDLIPYVESNKQLIGVTQLYVKDDKNWQTLNEDRPGVFQLNMSLAGAKVTDLKDPVAVPALYDPYGRHPRNRPETEVKFLASFVDGHAKAMTRYGWNVAAKYLTLNLKKYGKPLR